MPYIRQNKCLRMSAFVAALASSSLASLAAQETGKQAPRPPETINVPPVFMPNNGVPLDLSKSPAPSFELRDKNQDPIRIYRLQAGSSADYSNSIVNAVRWMLDNSCRVLLVPEGNTMLVRCTPEQLLVADRIVHDTDIGKPNYKLTYTITESEAGKLLGVQHFTLDVLPGARTTLKNGSRVPAVTGSVGAGAQTQFTYLDVGLNFDVTLEQGDNGLRLKSKVEQSASNEEKTMSGFTEPVIRQMVLEGSATLVVGKPLLLGSLDIAGSTRHSEVEVLLELSK